jgi:N-acetylglucosaminyldiphosphoundecaprenol N-acetyl-beta-D-mannosaminyltransferase
MNLQSTREESRHSLGLREASRKHKRNRLHFGRAEVDVVSREDVLARVREFLRCKPLWPAVILPVNAQLVHLAGQQPRFATLLERADLSIADGMSLVFASRLLGTPLPERIAGVDLVDDLCALVAMRGGSVYLLGGGVGAAHSTAKKLQNWYPGLQIAGVDCPPLGFEKMAGPAAVALQRIQSVEPDLLLVGLGAPKQEYWIDDNLAVLPCKVVIGVGGTFDILSAKARRAPHWMQDCGLEWLFRLFREPRRLWQRYLVGNSYFLWVVSAQFLSKLFSGGRKFNIEETQ